MSMKYLTDFAMAGNMYYLVLMACLGVSLADIICDDLDTSACVAMNASIPKMCSDSCLAAHCQRFCGKCPLKCYECHEVDHPSNCTNKVVCPSKDHYCVATQTFTDDFREVFKLGCALNSLCTADFFNNFVIGRRSIANVAGGCCQSDLCNNQHPSTMIAIGASETNMPNSNSNDSSSQIPVTNEAGNCQDIPGDTCLKLALKEPNMCQSDCLASRICPRTCGKCVECYTCSHVARPEECNHTTVCQQDQECFSLATLSSTFEQGFRLGCMAHNTCLNFYKSTPSVVGRRQNFEVNIQGGCCHTDYCNHQMIKPTTTPSTTTAIPTPHYSHCHSYYTSCPPGFRSYDKTCLLVGSTMDFTSAEAYCKSHCAHLADFPNSHELDETMDYLKHHYTHTAINEFYTDAVGILGQWIWNSNKEHVSSTLLHSSSSHHHVYFGTELCAAASLSSSTLTTVRCSQRLNPLCKLQLYSR